VVFANGPATAPPIGTANSDLLSATMGNISPPVSITVTAAGQKVYVSATADIGPNGSGGGGILPIMCYRTSSTAPWQAFDDEAPGMSAADSARLRIPRLEIGTFESYRVPISRAGYTALTVTGTTDVALCARSSQGGSGGTWNLIGYAKTTVVLLQ